MAFLIETESEYKARVRYKLLMCEWVLSLLFICVCMWFIHVRVCMLLIMASH